MVSKQGQRDSKVLDSTRFQDDPIGKVLNKKKSCSRIFEVSMNVRESNIVKSDLTKRAT